MKNSIDKPNRALLASSLLAALSITVLAQAADDTTLLRYQPSNGQFQFSYESDIRVGPEQRPLAGRKFSTRFEVTTTTGETALTLKLADADASYTAHGMKQRLKSKHLIGHESGLEISGNGRSMRLAHQQHEHGHEHGHEDGSGPEVNLGSMTETGYALDTGLVDLLPQLPEAAVGAGSSWETEATVRTLVGWAWAQGQQHCQHEVQKLESTAAGQIASVQSTCTAALNALEGTSQYSGDGTLELTTNWRFDVQNGQLLSLTAAQTTSGKSGLPQGDVEVLQLNAITLSTKG